MTYRIEERTEGLWATAVALGDAQGWESAERAEEALDALSEHEPLSGQYRIVHEQTGEVCSQISYASEAPEAPITVAIRNARYAAAGDTVGGSDGNAWQIVAMNGDIAQVVLGDWDDVPDDDADGGCAPRAIVSAEVAS